jgi:hypothetical protein
MKLRYTAIPDNVGPTVTIGLPDDYFGFVLVGGGLEPALLSHHAVATYYATQIITQAKLPGMILGGVIVTCDVIQTGTALLSYGFGFAHREVGADHWLVMTVLLLP